MNAKNAGRKRLVWKLRLAMVARGINTASELKRRLERLGYDITTTHAARIVAERPSRINVDLLEALVNVLDCEPNDILVIERVEETGGADEQQAIDAIPIEKKTESQGKVKKLPVRRVVAKDDDENFFGPKATSVPNPYDKKGK